MKKKKIAVIKNRTRREYAICIAILFIFQNVFIVFHGLRIIFRIRIWERLHWQYAKLCTKSFQSWKFHFFFSNSSNFFHMLYEKKLSIVLFRAFLHTLHVFRFFSSSGLCIIIYSNRLIEQSNLACFHFYQRFFRFDSVNNTCMQLG